MSSITPCTCGGAKLTTTVKNLKNEAPGQPEDYSDTPPEDDAEASPYDSEVEEEKIPVAVRAACGRPPGVPNKRGRIGGKGGR